MRIIRLPVGPAALRADLHRLLRAVRHRRALHALNRDFARLRADGAAWAAEQAERALWDATLLDDVTDDPVPPCTWRSPLTWEPVSVVARRTWPLLLAVCLCRFDHCGLCAKFT